MLTEKVKRNPYAVILLDEIEKAHADIFNLWLSVLEDGQLSDSHGRTINFKNTVIIMTTNIGLKRKGEKKQLGFGSGEKGTEQNNFKDSLEEFLRPEFLNRVDKIVIFNDLKEKDLEKITIMGLNEINGKLADRQLKVAWDNKVIKKLLKKCLERGEGARVVREILQLEIENPLADKIIKGDFNKSRVIKIKVKNNRIALT